jgi:hypothetical protein
MALRSAESVLPKDLFYHFDICSRADKSVNRAADQAGRLNTSSSEEEAVAEIFSWRVCDFRIAICGFWVSLSSTAKGG